jgi:hypothetical protein
MFRLASLWDSPQESTDTTLAMLKAEGVLGEHAKNGGIRQLAPLQPRHAETHLRIVGRF